MSSIADSILLYYDNSGAIAQTNEPRAYSKSKHMERKYRVIREIIEWKDIMVLKVQGLDNTSDPFTKAVPPKIFDKHVEEMRLRYYLDWH